MTAMNGPETLPEYPCRPGGSRGREGRDARDRGTYPAHVDRVAGRGR